jgi:hypothetical protein
MARCSTRSSRCRSWPAQRWRQQQQPARQRCSGSGSSCSLLLPSWHSRCAGLLLPGTRAQLRRLGNIRACCCELNCGAWATYAPPVAAYRRPVPACCQAGVPTPSLDDFLWATSIFWSRALALPVAYTQPGGSATGGGDSSSSSSVVRIKVLEGLVPGVDLANHSSQVGWWVGCQLELVLCLQQAGGS